jgi:hypothetical protein
MGLWAAPTNPPFGVHGGKHAGRAVDGLVHHSDRAFKIS